jgi:DNA-binding NtrC family response regulator
VTQTTLRDPIIGDTPAVRELRAVITQIAPFKLPVLVQGPTGSGKELVAQALHAASARAGAFVAFNVCAISESMFEDALFGHVQGAFTGATGDTSGYLTEADGGTLFLDEISGLPLPAQAKLLRAIETREFRPVGARTDRRSDFRVIAATNEDLRTLAGQGRFRSDLLFRLSGIIIQVPPLAERLDDVPALAHHFAREVTPNGGPVEVSSAALRDLQSYDWPGNVRELRQVIECAIALAGSAVLGRGELSAALKRVGRHPLNVQPGDAARQWLADVLEQHGWDTERAARHLGVHRATVYRRMQQLGLRRREWRSCASG